MFEGLSCKLGEVFGSFGQIGLRARRGQITCPQDEPVDSHFVVRDLSTAPRSTPTAWRAWRLPNSRLSLIRWSQKSKANT